MDPHWFNADQDPDSAFFLIPDPDPAAEPGDDKRHFFIFASKIRIRIHSTLKHENSLLFSIFVGHFCPLRPGSGSSNSNGSGSTTLNRRILTPAYRSCWRDWRGWRPRHTPHSSDRSYPALSAPTHIITAFSPSHTNQCCEIRIRRICMFLELLDPDPDPLVRGTDPDPEIIKQK